MNSHQADNILVVEDNPDTQILLRYLLQSRYGIHTVTRVEDALAHIEKHEYTLLLVDINLGEERTGVDLLNIVRDHELYATLPMVAITAYAMPGDDHKFLRMGFDAYISKPFSRTELYTAINQVLDHEKTS
ncbi:MAG: response regulator [Bacteroidota bacterium]